ncbi:MAG: SDR family oxidoreductase [Proteobacteria bacterium]|nr:SDR family oxidoreductase [Pseudomonadota bacterium]
MGRSAGRLLSQAGAAVVLGDIDDKGLQETVTSIQDAGGRALGVRTDVQREADVIQLVERAVEEYGRIDVMGNIAGIPQQSMIVDTREEDVDRVLGINLKGVFFGVKAALARMIEQGGGNIVNISSGVIDSAGVATWACYGMSKAGVAMLTKTAAAEGAPHGVRVNAIAPGLVVTGFTERHWLEPDGSENPDKKAAFLKAGSEMAPLGTIGKPEHIAHAILYLASDASEFVTGQILRPNGGVSMPW